MRKVAIVGAGHAGASVAGKLRTMGFEGEITLFGEEPFAPYERPPLSKAYLLGKVTRDRLSLRPASFYAENRIDLRTGERVEAIDRPARQLRVGGRMHAYDDLVLATGAAPIRLPADAGGALRGVHVLRTLDDVERLAEDCRPGARALVVGGGYIGLEAAAVFAGLGIDVVLAELGSRILQRVAAPETSDYFRALHGTRGVTIREGTGLLRLEGNGRVERALLDNGDVLDIDLVVVGIGVRPSVELAEKAGLVIDRGIAVNALGRTSDPAIWAAGDCASFLFRGERIRLESVQNAVDQAHAVAENLIGAGRDYQPVPWFWSDQFEIKLQIAGLNSGYDRVVVRPGSRPYAVSHWYFAGKRLLAVDAILEPRAFMCAKRLLETGIDPDAAKIADPAFDLKKLLPA